MRVDLHLHSSASDGKLSPAELVQQAAQLGIDIISIADHDSVEGVDPALEAARLYPSLRVVPAVEINTDVPRGEVHILGYFIDHRREELRDKLAALRHSRYGRARGMVAKLQGLGLRVDWGRVLELAAGGAIGRPHVAQALVEAGYVSNAKEAFERYIGRDGPAYVDRVKLTPAEAVQLIVRTGGLAVLAHPAGIPQLEAMLSQLKAVGLVGLEAYYDGYPAETSAWLSELSRNNRLIITGGSDFHGPGSSVDTVLGGIEVPWEQVQRLFAMAWQRSCPGAFPI
ncbi:MAG TPA: PHP domain-containing protein [Dehalococcoidia bacterium]|nr:PHP domain-containing protein [Dehalococcoidia bacterium]